MTQKLQQKIDKIAIQAVKDLTKVRSTFSESVLFGAVYVRSLKKLKDEQPKNTTEKGWRAILENVSKAKVKELLEAKDSQFVKLNNAKGKTVYTTKQIVEEEAKIIEISSRLANNKKNGLPLKDREKAAKDFEIFNREYYGDEAGPQKVAAVMEILDAGDLKIIDGPPGSGKSTILEGVARGLATTSKGVPDILATGATDKAASAMYSDIQNAANEEDRKKIKGFSIDGVIKRMQRGKVAPNSLVVVDEAGMLGTSDMLRLLDASEKAQVKLVLVGDAKQLPPNERGEPYRILTEYMKEKGLIRPSYLTETLRQKAKDEKVASEAFREGDALKALNIYNNKKYEDITLKDFEENVRHGKKPVSSKTYSPIRFVDKHKDAVSKTVEDYLKWHSDKPVSAEKVKDFKENGVEPSPETAVVITIDRYNAKKVNEQIREGLKAKGVITESKLFETPFGNKELGVSDEVLFNEKVVTITPEDGKQKINAGTTGKIESIFDDGSFAVKLEDNRTVKLPSNKAWALDYSYCVDVRTSQGMSKERAFIAVERKVDLAEMMVAMTRHQKRASVIISKEVYPDLKALAQDASVRKDKENIVDLVPDIILKRKQLGALR